MEKSDYYIGIITSIDDESLRGKEYHEVLVDIPEVAKGIRAFPKRGEVDEPRVGDVVLLLSLDPIYNSYMIYEKLKENDFIGFRASGKMVDITPEAITIGVFDKDSDFKDADRPDIGSCYIKLDKNNNIEVIAEGKFNMKVKGNITIECESDVEVKVKGNCKLETEQDTEIKANGNCKIEATNNVEVKGNDVKVDGNHVQVTGAQFQVNGTAGATGSGPFCGLPVCLFTGAPHVGNISAGN